jgi:hypothetical protein
VRSLLPIYSVEYIAGCTNVARATTLYTKHTVTQYAGGRHIYTFICLQCLSGMFEVMLYCAVLLSTYSTQHYAKKKEKERHPPC